MPPCFPHLQIAVADGPREGDGVADVADAGQVHDAAFEAEAEARVAGRAVFAQIQIEVVVFFLHAALFDAGQELLVVVFTLAAADDLADAGHEAVAGCHGLSVGVQLHVEGLDLLRIVGHEDGALEDLFGQKTLVFGLQVAAPEYLVGEAVVVRFEKLHGVGVADAAEVARPHVFQTFQQTLVHELVQEGHLLGRVLQHVADDIFQHGFRGVHVVFQVSEGHFRLDHPELRRVARGVRVLGAEGRPEGIDVAEGHGEGLAVQLSAHGQVRFLAEEVLREIDGAVFSARRGVRVERGHAEHLARAFAVAAGDEGRVHVNEAALLEEAVDRVRRKAADAEDRTEEVRAGPKVRDRPQEFDAVRLRLQRIVRRGCAFDGDLLRVDLERLLRFRRQDEFSFHDEARADVDVLDLVKVRECLVIDHLDGIEGGPVVQHDEAESLGVSAVSRPSAHGKVPAFVFGRAAKQFSQIDKVFHNNSSR